MKGLPIVVLLALSVTSAVHAGSMFDDTFAQRFATDVKPGESHVQGPTGARSAQVTRQIGVTQDEQGRPVTYDRTDVDLQTQEGQRFSYSY